MAKYDDLDRDSLIRLLQRRDAERQLGLVWERDDIEADAAVNADYVALTLIRRIAMATRRGTT
jgi:adenine-specific DNA-methyltransferase